MAFKGRTQEIAFAALQKAVIPYLHKVAHDGGADADLRHTDWRLGYHKVGGKVWILYGASRDMFVFRPLVYSKVHVESGPVTPAGEMKNVYALAQRISSPFPGDNTVSLGYQRGEELTLSEEDCKTLGASITTFIEGQIGGGEASGGSYVKAGVSTTLSGSVAKTLGKGKNNSELVDVRNDISIPAGTTGLIQQLIQSGPVRVKMIQRNVVDLGWDYVDYKSLRRGRGNGFLFDNRDWDKRSWNGKSRIVWKCENMNEWEALIAGQHEDYPRAHNMLNLRSVRDAYEYLSDEDNRTIEIESVCTFDKTVHGDLSFHAD